MATENNTINKQEKLHNEQNRIDLNRELERSNGQTDGQTVAMQTHSLAGHPSGGAMTQTDKETDRQRVAM